MTVHDLIKKYGTHSISLLLRKLALGPESIGHEMADDLQAALEHYASEDIEPPTVSARVI